MTTLVNDKVQSDELPPIVPYIGSTAKGEFCLIGSECPGCSQKLIGRPTICPSCGSRDEMPRLELRPTGRLYNYTIVHRCLPGVPVPFVFAVVDLDDGVCVKGNLLIDEQEIVFDMPVRVEFAPTTQTDAKGQAYLSYHFVRA